MKRAMGRFAMGATAVVFGLFTSRSAKADISQAVYDDTKEIIEQLLDAEVAESIVPNIACRGPEGIRIYLRETLQAAYTQDFAGMPKILHAEMADIAASYTYRLVKDRQPLTLKTFFGPLPTGDIKACVTDIKDNGMGQPQPGNDKAIAECDKLDPLADGAVAPQKTAYLATRLACEVGFSVREAVMDNLDNYRAHAANAIAVLIVQHATDSVSPAHEIDVIAELLTAVQTIAAAGPVPGLTATEQTMLNAVMPAWRTASSGSQRRFELGTALAAAVAAAGAAVAPKGNPLDPETQQLIALLRNDPTLVSDLKLIFDAVSHKDMHVLTIKTIDSMFEVVKVKAADDCKVDSKPDVCAQAKLSKAFALFATKLAAYLIEAENGTTDDKTAARKAFISATVQLLRDTDTGYQTGLQRDGDFDSFGRMLEFWTWTHETPGSRSRFGWLVPSVGMRVSWSEGYVDQSTSSHLRTVPAINWPKFIIPMRRRDWSYLGLQLTIGDIVAPFAEMSARKDGAYNATNSQRIWMNLFRPGLDILFGMPSLSEHLTLGLGGSLRPSRLFMDTSDPTNTRFSYESVFRCPSNVCEGKRGQYIGSFIEANLSAQYIF